MAPMQHMPTAALRALLLGGAACLLLTACGSSQTKTVTVASSPAETQSTTTSAPTTTARTTPTTTTATTTAPPATANGGAEAPTTTHTATEPAFTQQEPHSQGLSEAVSVLKAHGYTANETSQYHSNQTLQVLIGTSSTSSDGHTQQAFFFVRGRYIGTDTKLPSATVDVVAQSDTEVTLSYPLYRPTDPPSSPSGGHAVVRFQLNNGQLTSLDPIPPASSTTGLSRN
jgi:LppP/LprE lipoprotein